jgi:hypothetical protein
MSLLDDADARRLTAALVSRAGGYLRNPIRQPYVTCAVCTTPVNQYRLCYKCSGQSGYAGLADATAFLTYAVAGVAQAVALATVTTTATRCFLPPIATAEGEVLDGLFCPQTTVVLGCGRCFGQSSRDAALGARLGSRSCLAGALVSRLRVGRRPDDQLRLEDQAAWPVVVVT